MNTLERIGVGLVLTGGSIVGLGAATEGSGSAHNANIGAYANCSDGTSLDSNPEAVVSFTNFGDQVGNSVKTSVNGVVEDTHLVIAEQPDFTVGVQAAAGHIVVKAVWPGNSPQFSFDIKECEKTIDTTPIDTTTVPVDTTLAPTSTEVPAVVTTTSAVVAAEVPTTAAAVKTPVVTGNTLPRTGNGDTGAKLFLATGALGLGLGAARLSRRKVAR